MKLWMNGRSDPKNGVAASGTTTDCSTDTVGDESIADLEDPMIDEIVACEQAESANSNSKESAEDPAAQPTAEAEDEPEAETEAEGGSGSNAEEEPEAKAAAEAEGESETEAAAEAAAEPESESEAEAEAEPESESGAEADAVSGADAASEVEADVDAAEESSEIEAAEQADSTEPLEEITTTDSAQADSFESPAASPDRYGSPAVSEGLRRGINPGQAEGFAPPSFGALVRPAVAVLTICALLGLIAGVARATEETVRRELVYTLDESVPDSFLREDRRLLTQVVTMQSDAVLAPVAEQHGLTTDELRDQVDVETVDLSEVLRLDVRAVDPRTARSISDAIIDRYLEVSTEGVSAGANEALLALRTALATELAIAETEFGELQTLETDDARLQTTEESLERQIDLTQLQIDRLQGLLDDGLANPANAQGQGALRTELTAAESDLLALEGQLADVRVDRAELADSATAEPALTRRVARLETDLVTIDDEIASRELGPIVASPIRELGQPTVVNGSAVSSALRGLALGALIGIPFTALVALIVRRRQLWRS